MISYCGYVLELALFDVDTAQFYAECCMHYDYLTFFFYLCEQYVDMYWLVLHLAGQSVHIVW